MLLLKRSSKRKPTRFSRPNLAHPQLRDCLAWWPFTEGAGTVRDVVGNRDFNTVAGAPSWGTSANGRILTFNGTSDYLQAAGYDQEVPVTLSAWIRKSAFSGARSILYYGQSGLEHGILLVGDDIWALTQGGATARSAQWSSGATTETWFHVVGVFESAFKRTLYVDGIERAQDTQTLVINFTAPNIRIGNRFSSNQYFDGDVVDARVYSRALDAFEIKELYDNPWAPFERRVWVPTEAAPPGPITGTGALQAQSAAVVGVGDVITPVITGTGALPAQDATIVGVGEVIAPNTGTGTLQAQDAQVSGVGAVVHDGSGTLQSQDAAVVGVGEVGDARSGAGVLQADDAAIVGTGIRVSVGSGALQAQDAAVTGVGVVEGLTSGTGVLQAQDAAVAGTGHLVRVGSGALQAQTAQVAGVGAILGELTLSPADIAAIADAVYAKLVSEGLVQQINEVWQRRGLDSANPQTYDKAGNQIRVGNITIDLSGDPSSVTQTRQP